MEDHMADRAIVAVFDTKNRAYDAAKDLQVLADAEEIKLKRGAMVTKDDKGNLSVPETKHVGTAWGLLGGTAVGALLGALLGPVGVAAGAAAGAAATGAVVGAASGALVGSTVDLTEYGLDADFLDTVATELNPGDTAIIAEVEEGSTRPVDAVVARFGGRIYRTELE
jgi:uncharacterized membrane protein